MGTDFLYESIAPSRGSPPVSALSWYSPPTIKPPPVSLDVALLLGAPARESLACFRNGQKAASENPCRFDRAQGTRPSPAVLLPPRQRNATQHRGMERRSCQSPDTWAKTKKRKTIFFTLILVSSCLLICQAGRGSA